MICASIFEFKILIINQDFEVLRKNILLDSLILILMLLRYAVDIYIAFDIKENEEINFKNADKY